MTLPAFRLSSEDPLERLEELCSQTTYTHKFTLNRFPGMVACTLELNSSDFSLIKKTRFVSIDDGSANEEQYPKKVVAAIVLEELGLGVQPTAEEDTEEKMKEFAQNGMNLAMSAIGKLLETAIPPSDK